VAVTPDEEERITQVRTVDPEANDAYLRGRYYSYEWTEEGFRKGIRYYREAIEIDPTYALPYAGLADGYLSMALFGHMPKDDAMPKARAAAKKALALDPSLGVAHVYIGWIKFDYDWDWYGPDEDFRRAVALDPNNADVHIWYVQYLTMVGRHEEAIAHSKRAVELDPLTSTTTMQLAWVYDYAGRYNDAIKVSKTGIETNPRDYAGLATLAGAYFNAGMYEESFAAIDSTSALLPDPDEQVWLSWVGFAYGRSGREDEAEEILNRLLALSEDRYIAPHHIAMVYSGLGRIDEMFEWLEKGYETRSGGMMFLRLDFGEHRDDPRYIDLCRRIGIPLDD
jgi:tetratricopeptide (TPR) repeat protein